MDTVPTSTGWLRSCRMAMSSAAALNFSFSVRKTTSGFSRRSRGLLVCAALTRFRRFRRLIRFPKPVTAHMLRHTVATTLLFNGCPIGHIKDILGHDRLITTCNFYLGADKRAAKKAHGDFLEDRK